MLEFHHYLPGDNLDHRHWEPYYMDTDFDIHIYDWIGQQLLNTNKEPSILRVPCQRILATGGFMPSAIIRPACKKRFMVRQLTRHWFYRIGVSRIFLFIIWDRYNYTVAKYKSVQNVKLIRQIQWNECFLAWKGCEFQQAFNANVHSPKTQLIYKCSDLTFRIPRTMIHWPKRPPGEYW